MTSVDLISAAARSPGFSRISLAASRGDNGGDVLCANRQRDLRKNSAVLDGHYATDH